MLRTFTFAIMACSKVVFPASLAEGQKKNILFYLDCSGSMTHVDYKYRTGKNYQKKNIDTLLRRIKEDYDHINGYVQFFGPENRKPRNWPYGQWGWQRYIDGYGRPLNDKWESDISYDNSTSADNISKPLGKFSPPDIIAFVTDGEFDGRAHGANGVNDLLKQLTTLKEKNFLDNLKKLYVFFTPNTHDYVKKNMEDALLNFCTIHDNLTVSCHFHRGDFDIDNEIYTFIKHDLSKQVLNIPKNWYTIFDFCAFNKHMAFNELQEAIIQHDSDLPGKILKEMKYYVENKPEILLDRNKSYAKAHKLLHMLFKTCGTYRNYISETMRRMKGQNIRVYNILEQLIKNSFQDEEMNQQKMDKTKPYQEGEFIDFQFDDEKMIDVIRSKTMLPGYVSSILSDVRINDEGGFPILNEDAPQEILEIAYELIFPPYNISGVLRMIVIMTIMTSRATLPANFIDMTKRTALGMSMSIRKMIFADETEDIFKCVRWVSVIGKFLRMFHTEMFPDLNDGEKEKMMIYLFAAKVYDAFDIVYKGNVYSIERNIPYVPEKRHRSFIERNILGSAVLLPDFEKDPQKSLPSLGIIIAEGNDNVTVEYLDKPFNTGDTHKYRCKNDNTGSLFKYLSDPLLREEARQLNGLVMNMASREETQGPERNQVVWEGCIQEVKNKIKNLGHNTPEFVPVKLQVSNATLLSTILPPKIAEIVARGEKPNLNKLKEEYKAGVNNIDLSIKHKGHVFHLTEEEKERLRKELSTNNSDKILLEEAQLLDCPVCLGQQTEAGSLIFPCNHHLCKTCDHRKADYTGGNVDVAKHSCHICRALVPPDDARADVVECLRNAKENEVAHICNSCNECFLQEKPECAGGVLDTKCEKCRAKKFRECPECGVMIEHAGGCDHMTCENCNTDFCMVCGYVSSPSEDIYEDHIFPEHRGIYNTENA